MLVLWLTCGVCKMLLKILNKMHEVLRIGLCMQAGTIRLSIHAHEMKIAKYVTPLGAYGDVPSNPRLEISYISNASSI